MNRRAGGHLTLRLLCVVSVWASAGGAQPPCAHGFEDATGVLLDEGGNPIKASVTLLPLDDFDSFTTPVAGSDETNHYATLAPDGGWSCPCLRKGAYEVQIKSWAFSPVVARGTTGTPTRLTVDRSGAVVEGRVVAAPDIAVNEVHASVEFEPARVMSVLRWLEDSRRLKLEDDYSFKTPPLNDGRWVFKAWDKKGRRIEHPFEVRGGKAPRLEVAFPLGAVRGVVLGKDGAPVPDAGVSAKAESMFAEIARSGCGTVVGRGGFRTTTDKEGRFVLADLSASEKYWLEASGPNGESDLIKGVETGTEDLRLAIVRSGEPGELMVSAVGARQPRIELRRPHEFPDREIQRKGPVRFERVWPGPIEVDVFAAGKAARSVPWVVEPGKKRTLAPIALVDERPLTVRVHDEETGEPVVGARILLDDRLWQRAQVALDEFKQSLHGYPPEAAATATTVLHGLSPGRVAFSAYAKGYATARFSAEPGQAVIDIKLKRHGPVAVTLLARDGGLLQVPSEVEELGVLEPPLRVSDGRALLPRVDPGLHVLVQRQGGQPKLFPSWFTSDTDGGEVRGYEAVGGAVLRVNAFSEFNNDLSVRLTAGEVAEPRSRHPFWVLAQAAIQPTRRGQSGVQFEEVRPGTYTVLIFEPEKRLGQVLRYQVWRRVLVLGEGLVSIDLDSFERRPDLVTEWPPPDITSPNPLD